MVYNTPANWTQESELTTYRKRIIDEELRQLVNGVPAYAIEGPKAVGKTTSAEQIASAMLALDEAAQRELAEADADALLRRLEKPVLIDEWQRYPPIFDAVRRIVDKTRKNGQFILTGSATPHDSPTHTGAGRLVRIRMRPLAFGERGLIDPTLSLRDLLDGKEPKADGRSGLALENYVNELLQSGFPAIRELPPNMAARQLASYVEHIVTKDVKEAGHFERRPAAMREWLRAYAAATSTTASWETIRDAASPGRSGRPTRKTATDYREALQALWIVDPIDAWHPSGSLLRGLGAAPKHHLADPALACAALGATRTKLLQTEKPIVIPPDGTFLGNLFESLVALSIRVYAQASEAEVHHFRTYEGTREVDFIVSRGAEFVAIESKLAPSVGADDVKHLLWLKKQCGENMVAGMVVTTGKVAYRRTDGIYVVPLALLGA